MNHTTNYNLNQWDAEDRVTRADFNTDNAAIDAAFATKCEVVFGSYTGDGTYPRDIILSFKPKAVLLMPRNGEIRTSNTTNGGLFGPNSDLRDANYTYATSHQRVLFDALRHQQQYDLLLCVFLRSLMLRSR